MLTYWAVFAFFAIGAFAENNRVLDFHRRRPLWIVGGVLIILMVGFRYKVGADWDTYRLIFSRANQASFAKAITIGDPGYQALNWVVGWFGGEIVWVNLVCAILFTWGLFRLARVQPNPWLAVLVAVPYMVVVIACGYTRQAAALGIIMAGLSSLTRGSSLVRVVIFIALAASFHRTAVAVLPLVIFSRPTNRLFNLVGGLAALYAMWDLFLADSMYQFVRNYIESEYSSQGAAIRVAMAVLAAALFLLVRKDFDFPERDDKLWFYFSIASFAALAALIATPSSTAVDRMSIYLMPLQMVILSRIPFVYNLRGLGVAAVVAYGFAVQFVWLNFATHAEYWVPYQTYPLFS